MTTPKKKTTTRKKPKSLTEKSSSKPTAQAKRIDPNEIIGFGTPEDDNYMDDTAYDLSYLMTHLLSAVSPKINQAVTFDLLYGMFAHDGGIDEHIAIETGMLIGASHTVPASRETH